MAAAPRWRKSLGPTKGSSVTALKFLKGITRWTEAEGHAAELEAFDDEIKEEGLWSDALLQPPPKLREQMGGGAVALRAQVFLQHVLLPIVDEDTDGVGPLPRQCGLCTQQSCVLSESSLKEEGVGGWGTVVVVGPC